MVRGKHECLKTSVRTGNDINFFSLEALVCRDETEDDPEKWPWKSFGYKADSLASCVHACKQ